MLAMENASLKIKGSQISDELLAHAVAFMRHIIRVKSALIKIPTGATLSQPARTASSIETPETLDDLGDLYMKYIIKIVQMQMPVRASSLAQSHCMPPVVDSTGKKYTTEMANKFLKVLSDFKLGSTSLSARRALSFQLTAWDNLSSEMKHLFEEHGIERYEEVKRARLDYTFSEPASQ